jgi:hypothetical protein
MLKVQTIAVECPRRSKIAYEVSIPLSDFSPEFHEVSVIGPGGQVVPCSRTDLGVQFERCDGPGVARFQAVVRDRSESAGAKDAVTIEVVVIPAAEPAVREAIGAAISAMQIQINGINLSGSVPDTGAEAYRLQKSFGEMAAAEVLRRLALDGCDATTVLRSLLLLTDLVGRTAAQWLPPMAFAVMSDLAGSMSNVFTSDRLLDACERLALPAQEKWFRSFLRSRVRFPVSDSRSTGCPRCEVAGDENCGRRVLRRTQRTTEPPPNAR